MNDIVVGIELWLALWRVGAITASELAEALEVGVSRIRKLTSN